MKKTVQNGTDDDLRAAYDLRPLLGNGVRGKYVQRYRAGTNLVLLAPDVARAFANDGERINRALRMALRPSAPSGHQKQSGTRVGAFWRATVKPPFRQRLRHKSFQQPRHSRHV